MNEKSMREKFVQNTTPFILEVITPVTIGNGQDLKVLDYILDTAKQKVYILNQKKWLQYLYSIDKLSEYESYVENYTKGEKETIYEWMKRTIGIPKDSVLTSVSKQQLSYVPSSTSKKSLNDSNLCMSLAGGKNSTKKKKLNKKSLNDIKLCMSLSDGTPYIPGSSLKGKIRTLLARYCCDKVTLNSIDIDNDNEIIKRLFGSTNNQVPARLQFRDLFVTDESERIFDTIDTDTYMGEIKFENTINRVTSVANPRQIERVPAGTKFDFELVYTIVDETQVQEDLKMLTDGFNLLKLDYLGGHGTRGYGRVEIDITEVIRYPQSDDNVSNEYLRILQNKELTECEKDKENA